MSRARCKMMWTFPLVVPSLRCLAMYDAIMLSDYHHRNLRSSICQGILYTCSRQFSCRLLSTFDIQDAGIVWHVLFVGFTSNCL